MNRRVFLKRASQAVGVVVMLPAAKSLGATGHSRKSGYYEHTIIAMGTTARLGVYARSEEAAHEVITPCFAELKRIESLLTIFDESSEISKINSTAGRGQSQYSTTTIEILSAAEHYTQLTSGAFDATVEPLMRLWGFRSDSNILTALPTEKAIEDALSVVGSNRIEIDGTSARLNAVGAKLDLGGIAVGYSLDRMVTILRNASVEDAFIDISGDMFALGNPRGAKGWEVAIPDPQNTSRMIYQTKISDEALATSGSYESYVTYQALQFGHIMDPDVGRSAHRLLSSTIIAKSGLDADALSTASFVSGHSYSDSKLLSVDLDGYTRVA